MIDYFEKIDQIIFLFINGHNSPLGDSIMWFVSEKWSWIPLYLIFIFLLIKKDRKDSWLPILFALILIGLTDQISVRIFKDVFLRYRPCHNEILKGSVHLVNNYCGGLYGFVSSHAANSFALATFLSLVFKRGWILILVLFWASLVSFSRVYLGVHYPSDVICGGILGVIMGMLIFIPFGKIKTWTASTSNSPKIQ